MKQPKYNVKDKVWTLENNKCQEYTVYAVTVDEYIDSMSFKEIRTYIKYVLMQQRFSFSRDKGLERKEAQLYDTKEALVEAIANGNY